MSERWAHQDFRIGQRVRLSDHAIDWGIHRHLTKPIYGTVVGFGGTPERLSVIRDGTHTRVAYHRDFWEPVGETPDQPGGQE